MKLAGTALVMTCDCQVQNLSPWQLRQSCESQLTGNDRSCFVVSVHLENHDIVRWVYVSECELAKPTKGRSFCKVALCDLPLESVLLSTHELQFWTEL